MKNDDDKARVLNIFFSNIVRYRKIPNYNNCDALAENIQEPVLKAIVKYRNHPSILTIGEVCNKYWKVNHHTVSKATLWGGV